MIHGLARNGLLRVVFTGVVLTAVLTGAQPAAAQQLLSLRDAINIALEESYEMKSLRLSLVQSEENYKAAKFRFRTNADLEFSTPSWSERVSAVQVPNALPVYNSLGTMRYRGELNINQPLPTGGGITLSNYMYQSRESNYFAETDNSLERKDFVTSMSIRLNQPLFTYNRLKTGLRRAELNFEDRSLAYSRGELDMIYSVTNSFYALYRSTRNYEIALESLEQQQEQYDLARLKFEAGLIPEVEALRTEVNLASAKSRVLDAEASLERQREQFKVDIGLSLDESIGIRTEIEYADISIDLDKAIEHGLAHRTEIREQQIAVELNKISLKEVDARREIRADLSAYYDLTGRSDPALPVSTGAGDLFDSSWDDLNRRPGNRGVTLTFSVPVWDWGVNKSEVASARADLRRSELQLEEQKKEVVTSITDAVRQVLSAENSLEVLQKSQEVAQRMYEISLERFNNGEITSLELADDQANLSDAKMAYLNAYISYKLAIADLKRKTWYDFELDQPLD